MHCNKSKIDKCIIIDFDHTIGYFKQIIYLLNIVEVVYKRKITNSDVKILLDSYPNIFRPKLYEILNVILKNKHHIQLFILYTCNTHKTFINKIISYLEFKFNDSKKIFDYQLHENTGVKSIKNIKNNILHNLHMNTIYCFIDNKKYNKMSDKKLKYIHCEKYIHDYTIHEVIKNFPFISFSKINKLLLKKYLQKYYQKLQPEHLDFLPRNSYIISSMKLISLMNDFILLDLVNF